MKSLRALPTRDLQLEGMRSKQSILLGLQTFQWTTISWKMALACAKKQI